MYSVPRFAKRRMKKLCRCMKDFTSWKHIGAIPHRLGKENHAWVCQVCGRTHVTADKRKPSANRQRDRKIRGG